MSSPALHHAVAERGKTLALGGDHVGAMRHYQKAMSLAVGRRVPEVVFRHYMECALESLERIGEHEEVLRYCSMAIEHYREHPPTHRLARLDLASIYQRRGVVCLRMGREREAHESLELAIAQVADDGRPMPLAQLLLRWLVTRVHVSPPRLERELVRHRYYAVRKDNLAGVRGLADAVDAVMGTGLGT